ncbi:MAG: 6-phosphogluconolactonase [Pyrinomonadaceae bacterium]|nr:6-phosphogluconolactonase [Pyrinomonadaceae bacterium]
MTETEIRIYKDAEALSADAAEEFIRCAKESIAARGRFAVALAGGGTPRALYSLLASPDKRDRVDWTRTHIFWGDERCVSPTSEDSNYRTAHDALLSKVSMRPQNIHRIEAERADVDKAARDYEIQLQMFFGLTDGDAPHFDLILLGMGRDGHTASLFPGSDTLEERHRLAVVTWNAGQQMRRITLTLPVLNNARVCIFLVSGKDKAETLREVLQAQTTNIAATFPAQLVKPERGRLVLLVDEAAASLLEN